MFGLNQLKLLSRLGRYNFARVLLVLVAGGALLYFANIQENPDDGVPIAVLVLCANRPKAVQNHLTQLTRQRPSPHRFPIVVSQDGNLAEVTQVIEEFVATHEGVQFIHHKEQDATGWDEEDEIPEREKTRAYIAHHYKWALDQVFMEMGFEMAIVTEEDLDIADDFFSYFAATSRLLNTDPSVWCVSAFNDNAGSVDCGDQHSTELLLRSDYFASYGFMLKRALWVDELSAVWPVSKWDNFMRLPHVRKERVCIVPSVSRTRHNGVLGEDGTSSHRYKHIYERICFPERPIDFHHVDLRRMKKERYDVELVRKLQAATEISLVHLLMARQLGGPKESYRVVYRSTQNYKKLAAKFFLTDDFWYGVPRTAYYGVTTIRVRGWGTIYAVHQDAHLDQELNSRFGSELNSNVYNTSWNDYPWDGHQQ